jgi:hypothetical protein
VLLFALSNRSVDETHPESILAVIEQLAFGVNCLYQPLAILVTMVAQTLWAASLGLLIGALVQRAEPMIMLCLIAIFAAKTH